MYLVSVRQMGMYLVSVRQMGMYLVSVRQMGMYLVSVQNPDQTFGNRLLASCFLTASVI